MAEQQGPSAAGPQGPPGADGSSLVREVHRDGDAGLTRDTDVTIATMSNVDPGSYVIYGKTTAVRLAGGENPQFHCELTAGADNDFSEADGVKEFDHFTMGMHLVTTFAGTGTVTLHCSYSSSNATFVARETKIIALKVGTVTADPVVG
jgi:hypothetical protein